MEIISGSREYHLKKGPVITIGNFDGIHIGHKHLINCVLKQARLKNNKSVVYTFRPHPSQILQSGKIQHLLGFPRQEEDTLRRMGVDCLIIESFTKSFSQISPEDFIEKYVVAPMNPSLVIVGSNFRFGSQGIGNIHLLKNLAEKYRFSLKIKETVYYKGLSVSSSLIRQMILSGRWDLVPGLLDRPFSVKGVILKGFGRGKTLGFPTINLKPDEQQIIPTNGVYISQLVRKSRIYQAVVNIGISPTFSTGPSERVLEVHIIEPCDSESWPDKEHEVRLLEYVRPEKKFPSTKQLIQQIHKDIRDAKVFFQNSAKRASKKL